MIEAATLIVLLTEFSPPWFSRKDPGAITINPIKFLLVGFLITVARQSSGNTSRSSEWWVLGGRCLPSLLPPLTFPQAVKFGGNLDKLLEGHLKHFVRNCSEHSSSGNIPWQNLLLMWNLFCCFCLLMFKSTWCIILSLLPKTPEVP